MAGDGDGRGGARRTEGLVTVLLFDHVDRSVMVHGGGFLASGGVSEYETSTQLYLERRMSIS